MIQDIFPCRLDHAFRDREPEPEDCFFSFRGGEVLLRVSEDGSRRIPVFHDLGLPFAEVRRLAVFLFCVDGVSVYLLRQQGNILPERKGMQYLPLRELDGILPGWAYFAGATALHLAGWYERNVYCGRCGGVRTQDRGRRSLSCPDCGDTVYPAIAPVVMVAVTDGDRLLGGRGAERHYRRRPGDSSPSGAFQKDSGRGGGFPGLCGCPVHGRGFPGTWPEGPCGEPDREWRLSRDGAGACGGHRASGGQGICLWSPADAAGRGGMGRKAGHPGPGVSARNPPAADPGPFRQCLLGSDRSPAWHF